MDADGFEIETLMNIRALKARLRVVEVPSFEHARVHGVGRLRTIPDGWRVLRTIGREWRAGWLPGAVALPAPPVVAFGTPALTENLPSRAPLVATGD